MNTKITQFKVVSGVDDDIFWKKLLEENAWSLTFAKGAFTEYKKFIWLTQVSDRRLVPSTVIDNVWHLHMTFTKSYWHDLCRDILHRELHHTPSANDAAAKTKNYDDYCNTLKLYKQEFGASPPEQYWPRAKKTKYNAIKVGVLLAGTALLLPACSSISADDIETYAKWGVGIFIVYKVLYWLGSNNGGGRGGRGGGAGGCGGCSAGCGGD